MHLHAATRGSPSLGFCWLVCNAHNPLQNQNSFANPFACLSISIKILQSCRNNLVNARVYLTFPRMDQHWHVPFVLESNSQSLCLLFCIEDNFQIGFKKDGLLAQPHVPPSSCIFKKIVYVGRKERRNSGQRREILRSDFAGQQGSKD